MNNQMRFIPISNQYYTILHEKALKLDSLQSRLEKIYGQCHEICFLVPATESKNVYDKIEEIYLNIWK